MTAEPAPAWARALLPGHAVRRAAAPGGSRWQDMVDRCCREAQAPRTRAVTRPEWLMDALLCETFLTSTQSYR